MERRSLSLSTPGPSPIHLHKCYRYAVLFILYVQTLTDSSSLALATGSYDSIRWAAGIYIYNIVIIAEATVPAIYQQSFGAVDPTNSGETSVNSLSRVLSTSSLPAATVDKVRHTYTIHPFHYSILILILIFSFSYTLPPSI
jgi:hypothetical protein